MHQTDALIQTVVWMFDILFLAAIMVCIYKTIEKERREKMAVAPSLYEPEVKIEPETLKTSSIPLEQNHTEFWLTLKGNSDDK